MIGKVEETAGDKRKRTKYFLSISKRVTGGALAFVRVQKRLSVSLADCADRREHKLLLLVPVSNRVPPASCGGV